MADSAIVGRSKLWCETILLRFCYKGLLKTLV